MTLLLTCWNTNKNIKYSSVLKYAVNKKDFSMLQIYVYGQATEQTDGFKMFLKIVLLMQQNWTFLKKEQRKAPGDVFKCCECNLAPFWAK